MPTSEQFTTALHVASRLTRSETSESNGVSYHVEKSLTPEEIVDATRLFANLLAEAED